MHKFYLEKENTEANMIIYKVVFPKQKKNRREYVIKSLYDKNGMIN